jgi:ABC-type polysaccharide/polyol phosphate export permease
MPKTASTPPGGDMGTDAPRTAPVYDSAATDGSPMREAVVELIRYKDLLRLLIATNIKARYKRSVLGVAWTLLSPLLTMIVITVAFSAIFRFSVPNYPVYVLAGLVFFNFFQESTTQSMTSLLWGSALLKKVYVPAAVFPISAVGTALVNLGLTLVPLLLITLYFKQPLNWTLLFVPAAMAMAAMFSLGVGLILSSIAVVFSDVVEMWGVIVRALFYLTPVMYPEEIVPERLIWLVKINPLYDMMLCWREPIYRGALPPMDSVLKALVWSVGTLLVGWWVFSRRSHQFALRA